VFRLNSEGREKRKKKSRDLGAKKRKKASSIADETKSKEILPCAVSASAKAPTRHILFIYFGLLSSGAEQARKEEKDR
jgi:hypothetical protein